MPVETEPSLLSSLLGHVTHELKTPLHAILSLASVLGAEVDGPLTDEQRRQVEMIRRNAEQLLEIITQLLSFSTLGARSDRVVYVRFMLEEVFKELNESLQAIGRQKSINLEFDYSSACGEFVSDVFLIRQILSNLIQNAFKYSPECTTVGVIARLLPSGELNVQIADEGMGIPIDVQRLVFDRFYRLGKESISREGSVGLGLALVRVAVEQLGGKIELRSEKGKGSLFDILIPPGHAVEPLRKIVVVGSGAMPSDLYQAMLTPAGFVVEVVSDLTFVKAVLESGTADLIIIDWDGIADDNWRATAELLKLPRAVPVIVACGVDGAEIRATLRTIGVEDVIFKPFRYDEMLSRVREHTGTDK